MADENTTESTKAEVTGDLPAHLADIDYVGPLSADQAQARIAKFGYGHLRAAKTKPAAAPQEKGVK